MSEALLSIRDLCMAFGGLVVTDHVDLDVRPNEIHALIGPNGAGKTTLIAQITGELQPSSGEVVWRGEGLAGVPTYERVRRGLARSFQVSKVLPDFTVLDNARLAALGCRLPTLGWWRPASSEATAASEALQALERVGLAARADTAVGALSYGDRRHLEIAMALALKPSLLLLDEPTAGVGPDESRRLTALLDTLRQDCAILLIEHDMDVVFSLADRVSVLVAGRVIATEVPSVVRNIEEVQRAYFGTEDVW